MPGQYLTAVCELHPTRAKGRSRAKARGQHMGRPPKLAPHQQQEARRRSAEGATLKELAKSYNVGRATISRLAA
jgi:DNA invertase Pin-like site-specific DNA recombinase